ncbi:Myb/SANT-like DNA-binding domain 4 [Sergentomyia squamirostris]
MSINPGMTFSGNKNMEIFGSIFPEMLSGRKFVDVTLAVEGRRIQCHRLVLAAYSSYFSDLLEENPAQHPIIIFSGEIKFWMIQALVEFMYRGEVSVREADFGDLMKCAETLKIQGFNHENRIQGTENSLPQREIAEPVGLINEFKTEVLDSEDTKFFYPGELIHPANPLQAAENSGDSSLMNRSAEIVPELVNFVDVERKKPKQRQRKTFQNYSSLGKMKNENSLSDYDGKTKRSFREKKKICKISIGSPSKNLVLPCLAKKKLFDQNTMWSAVMEVKNGMAVYKAAQKFNISAYFIRACMKKYGIKSKFEHQRELDEIKTDVPNVEEPVFTYPSNFMPPESPPAAHEPLIEIRNSEETPFMNKSAEIVPEMLNYLHVEQEEPDLHQQGTSQNYRIPGEMETVNTSMDSEDETENSSWKERKIDEIPFGSPPKDFFLPDIGRKRSYDEKAMWSALMSVKNGISVYQASQEFKIHHKTICTYMKKYGIVSKSKIKRCNF